MRVTLLRSAGTGNRGTKRAACAAPADMEDASLHDMQAVSNYIGTERHLSNMTCDGRPATAMFVDFHLDNKFNTSITKCIQHCLGLHLSGIYIWAVTGSSFLAVVGMSEILLSIPCAWFLMRVTCQVKYFEGMNMMCIFIVCAIGATTFSSSWTPTCSRSSRVPTSIATWRHASAGCSASQHWPCGSALQQPARPSSATSGRHSRTRRHLAPLRHSRLPPITSWS